jgi:uncharacterized membrane protein YbhN (UPF0104 family)
LNRQLQIFARWAFFSIACFVIYRQLLNPQDTQDLGDKLLGEFRGSNGYLLLFVLLLVPVNWGIESLKWVRLVERIQPLPFYRAMVAVLVGTGLGLFTPNRTGEFLGRVLFIDPGKRIRAAFATGLGSLAQFVVTLVLGTLGLGFYLMLGLNPPLNGVFINRVLMVLAFSAGAIALLAYLYPGILKRAVELVPVLSSWRKHAEILVAYERKELLIVLGLSVLRYSVFALQFILVLKAFSNEPDLVVTVITTCVMYLITTLVPTVVLTELGVRGAAATSLFVPLGVVASDVLLATFAIWCFNLLLPALLGAVLFLFAQIKWRRSEE